MRVVGAPIAKTGVVVAQGQAAPLLPCGPMVTSEEMRQRRMPPAGFLAPLECHTHKIAPHYPPNICVHVPS